MENIAQYLIYLAFFSGLLPITSALLNYRSLNKTLKIAGLFFTISAVFDLAGYLVRFLHIRNNVPIYHFYNLFYIVFIGTIYYRSFEKISLKNSSLSLFVIVFVVIVFDMIKNGIQHYPSFSNTALGICLIPIALIYFYELLNRQELIYIESNAMFWINAGILIYFSINIFLFMLHNSFKDRESRISYYMIQSITNIITNIFFTIGLFCKTRKVA